MLEDALSKFLSRRRVAAARGAIRPLSKGPLRPTYRVVIVGGGVAALEAALAIRALAGGLVMMQIIAPETDFVYKPLEVREPFAGASAPHFDLAEFAASIDAELITDRLLRVGPLERLIFTERGDAYPYDALVLCLGASPVPRYEHARVIEPGKLDETLHGFVQDIEGGYIKRAAFIVPERVGWPLPIYEMLLMTAERASASMADVDLTLITSEAAPLGVFGEAASTAVSQRLQRAGVTVLTSSTAEVPGNKIVDVTTSGKRIQLHLDSIVTLPELVGRAAEGLPGDEHGFLPVDEFGLVTGQHGIFAAGDGTDGRIKQGGVAAQQAEVVALGVAKLAGAPVQTRPLRPVLRGVLLTGGEPLVLGEQVDGAGTQATSGLTLGKIAAPRLAAYFALHAPAPVASRS